MLNVPPPPIPYPQRCRYTDLTPYEVRMVAALRTFNPPIVYVRECDWDRVHPIAKIFARFVLEGQNVVVSPSNVPALSHAIEAEQKHPQPKT